MSKNLLNNLLVELYEEPILQGNHVVTVLTKHCNQINYSSRELCYEDIIKLYNKTAKGVVQKMTNFDNLTTLDNSSAPMLDFRIKKIEIKNIKCYTQAEDKSPFGVSFTNNKNDDHLKNNTPQSTIIYGTNGIGKSALFSTIEYVYTGRISEFENRQLGIGEDCLKNLAHDGIPENVHCKIYTPEQILDTQQNSVLAENFYFITNSFINEATNNSTGNLNFGSQGDYSIHQLIANGVGLKNLMDFSLMFNKMTQYNRQKERREYAAANLEVNRSRNLLANWNDTILQISAKLSSLQKDDTVGNINTDDAAKTISIISKLLANRIKFIDSTSKLEGLMRDFLIAHQELLEIENFSEIEHHYQMVFHAQHLVKEQKGVCSCPLCSSKLEADFFETHLENKLTEYRKRIKVKDNVAQCAEQVYEEIDNIIEHCNNFISAANDTIFQLAKYPQLSYAQTTLSKIIELITNYKDNEYLNEILTIRKSNESITKLHSFLYFELEHLILISIEIYNRAKELTNDFYKHLEELTKESDIEEEIDISRQISQLEQELDYISSQVSKERIHLTSLIAIADKAQQKLDLQIKVSNQIKDAEPVIRKLVNKKVVELFLPIKSAIEEIMETFLIDDNVTLDINCNHSYININVITDEGLSVAPAIYFNGFRFKLFCTALSFAMILVVRERIKINVPIIFDDPFAGFDTNDRMRMSDFVRRMETLVKNFSSPENPIQIISFTHNWQLFQILRTALMKQTSPQFLILDSHKMAQKADGYYELARRI